MELAGAFRDVNDSIRKRAASGPASEAWEFFCECDDVSCRVLVSLTLDEFDEHRAGRPAQPILAAHHAA
jgi:hypothetical protein